MPTATTTMTQSSASNGYPSSPPQIPLNGTGSSSKSSKSKSTTLDALYKRASKAFLHRDFAQTYSLVNEAFTQLRPVTQTLPHLSYSAPKFASSDTTTRRKWDILRISLESTFYTSPPPTSSSTMEAPDLTPLRALLVESPHTLVTNAWKRSLELFTPLGSKPSAEFVPSQILQTLVYASLKTDCPDIGRLIIEDWLGRRPNLEDSTALNSHGPELGDSSQSGDGYGKILELYCLQVLPKLGQWEYSQEFLRYESELKSDIRENLQNKLQSFYSLHVSTTSNEKTPTPSGATSPRPISPAPSISSSSSSSSVSTTSTQTVVPSTSRIRRESANGVATLTPINAKPSASSSRRSSLSDGSSSTITAKAVRPNAAGGNGHADGLASSSSAAAPRPPLTNRGKPNPSPLLTSANGAAPRNARSPLRASQLASSRSASASSSSTTASTSRRVPFSHSFASSSVTSPSSSHFASRPGEVVGTSNKMSAYDVVKSVLRPYLNMSKRKMIGLVLLLVVLPFLSWVLSVRRRNKRVALGIGAAGTAAASGASITSNAELVKRRLQAQAGSQGVVGKLWSELSRAIVDTVKMAGSGLV